MTSKFPNTLEVPKWMMPVLKSIGAEPTPEAVLRRLRRPLEFALALIPEPDVGIGNVTFEDTDVPGKVFGACTLFPKERPAVYVVLFVVERDTEQECVDFIAAFTALCAKELFLVQKGDPITVMDEGEYTLAATDPEGNA